MWGDEVLEQVRATREAHAARFGFDVQAILTDLRRRESASGHEVVMPAPANGSIATTPNQTPRKAGALVS